MAHNLMARRALKTMRMLMGLCMTVCAALFVSAASGMAAPSLPTPEFAVHRQESGKGPTILIVGGIQGDEPGGFSAASLLITNYTVEYGNIWVAPNVEVPGMLARSRGITGDMNRKFADISPQDPDFAAITRLKEMIADPKVALVLNLHDGSGYYRPVFEDNLRNPRRWGQSVIIDQESLPGGGDDLQGMALRAVKDVNRTLVAPLPEYHLKNTRTADGDAEMEKTLSYFAVRNGKPAFGIEASKEFSVELRAYYHLNIVESFMRQMGIQFTRRLTLSPRGVRAALEDGVEVAFEDRIILPLANVRPTINYLPLPRAGSVNVSTTKPILAVVGGEEAVRVHYGNNMLTQIKPEWREYDYSLQEFLVEADGELVNVLPGGVVPVQSYFSVKGQSGYRVNVIGFQTDKADESDMRVTKADFISRYSLDCSGAVYRVEAYKGEYFSGMFLVRFGSKQRMAGKPTLPAVNGAENELGW